MMTEIIGWTPSSHGLDPETSTLNDFLGPFGLQSINDNEDFPAVRSGHRCFTDNDFFYVIGGYTDLINNGSIYKEIWAMSLATFEWRRYETNGEFPESLASFAIIQIFPYSKSFILFGGSGTNFGATSSNSFYLIHVNNNDCTIESRKLDVQNTIPQPVYGHAMCAGEAPGKYYIIGGTGGTIFNFDVHALTMKVNPLAENENEKLLWSCELISRNVNYTGRYRLEATYDEIKHRLIFFGGGNNVEVFGFETMVVLDLETREMMDVASVPDAEKGFPPCRRCHTIARLDRRVIMTGGMDHTVGENEVATFTDVWIFDLNSFSWSKYEYFLPKPVFFHDSVMTEDGWLLSFGGVHKQIFPAPRSNILYGAWFGVPTLKRFSLEVIRKRYPHMFTGLYCGNLRTSDVIDVFNLFFKKGSVEEKERKIIENGKMKFREKGDRSRYFFNANHKDYVVKHEAVGVFRANRRRLPHAELAREVQPRPRRDPGLNEVLNRILNFVNIIQLPREVEDDESGEDEGWHNEDGAERGDH
uniref:Kelch domain-containing protein 10 n=1 Tax=Caenorhabditis tropicalis TaxID=1561998 RepID=A0A1I7TE61_9PELO